MTTIRTLNDQQHQSLLRRCSELLVLADALKTCGDKTAQAIIEKQVSTIKLTLENAVQEPVFDSLFELLTDLSNDDNAPAYKVGAGKLLQNLRRLAPKAPEPKPQGPANQAVGFPFRTQDNL